MSRLSTLTLILLGFGVSCAPRPQPAAQSVPAPRTVTPPLAGSDARATALAVVRRANDVRVEARVRALVEDAALTNAAQRYAEELARLQRLDHVSPTLGLETMTKRIEAAGGKWRQAGENLATTYNVSDMPRTVIDMWLNSPGHRRSLLGSAFTRTGVGVARDTRGAWYIVQLYVLPPARR